MENRLRSKGPLLSNELINYLVRYKRISRTAARKRLSRLTTPITKIKGLFSDNQALYHLQEQYKKPEFYTALLNSFKKSGKKYFAVINAIKFNYGYLKNNELPTYTFNPIKNLKGHKRLDKVLEELENLDVIIKFGDYYKLNPNISIHDNYNHSKAMETARNFVLTQFSNWAKNTGFASFNTSRFHSEFGKFSWSYTSPSYSSALVKYNKNKEVVPGFIIADVLLGNKIDMDEINFFINKIDVLHQLKNLPNFLPILILDQIEVEALKKLKSKGIVIGFVDQLFGKEYKEILNSLINVITNAAAILKRNPTAYLDLIDNLKKLVIGKTNNLRGDLFELAVGYYHSNLCQSIDIGKIINYSGRQLEVDVFALYHDKVVIAECKGYKSEIDDTELKQWTNSKIPRIRQWVLTQNYLSKKEIVFEYWSTGGYSKKAKSIIKKFKPNKFSVEFIDKDFLLEKSKLIQSKKFSEILRNYYLSDI